MYTKIHTPSIILDAYDSGDADRVYRLFTPELGVIFARAQSVRTLRSRHRYALQIFGCPELSLVRGSYGWRITNTQATHSLYSEFRSHPKKLRLVQNVLSVLKRLIQGEEHNEALFRSVWAGFTFLKDTSALDTKDIERLEITMVLRIMYNLGYVESRVLFEPVLSDIHKYSNNILEQVGAFRIPAIREINRALKASQM